MQLMIDGYEVMVGKKCITACHDGKVMIMIPCKTDGMTRADIRKEVRKYANAVKVGDAE